MDSKSGAESGATGKMSEEERQEILMILKDLGNHVDLEEINRAFMAERERFTDKQYKALLALNLINFLNVVEQDPDSIKRSQWLWLFQTMGYLGIDPKSILSDLELSKLSSLN